MIQIIVPLNIRRVLNKSGEIPTCLLGSGSVVNRGKLTWNATGYVLSNSRVPLIEKGLKFSSANVGYKCPAWMVMQLKDILKPGPRIKRKGERANGGQENFQENETKTLETSIAFCETPKIKSKKKIYKSLFNPLEENQSFSPSPKRHLATIISIERTNDEYSSNIKELFADETRRACLISEKSPRRDYFKQLL